MEVVRGIQALGRSPRGTVVTIGNFDGVHLGHRHIIELTRGKAAERGGIAVAYTFRPHPQVALRPGADLPLLTTYDERAELLAETGLDLLIEEPFSREFSTTPPETFFREILLRRLDARAVVVGYDFAFGKGREGSLDLMSRFCAEAGVELTVVPPQRADESVVSSSRIRQLLRAGEVAEARALLGREFFYRGTVAKGEGRGRKIGFPTANLAVDHRDNKLALPYGVYATRALVKGRTYAAVTNIGVRPTFGKEAYPALIETHLLGEDLDLYGLTLEVRFVAKLRDERKFTGIDELKRQILVDCDQARARLAAKAS